MILIPLMAAAVFGTLGISNSICNTIGKFAGYFLTYELGGFLGRKMSKKTDSWLFDINRGAFVVVVSAGIISACYLAFGGNVVLKALYRIPVGVLMSFALFCLFFENPAFDFFALAGRVTLQGYLLHVASCVWVKTFTPAYPYWLDGIIFVVIVCLGYFVPIALDKRFGKSVLYSILFHPYSNFNRLHAEYVARKHEKAGK